MPESKEVPEAKNVHEALNQLMGRVGYVQKEDAKGLNYSFASEVAFIRAIRPHMVDLGLTIYQSSAELLGREEFESKGGARGINLLFGFEWTVTHAPSGTSIVVSSVGEAADYGDKAANKAMTAGLKYAMRQTLVIETGDDPDFTSSDEFERAKEGKAREMSIPSTDGRKANQWEKGIVEKAVEFELVQAKPHAVNILNESSLFNIPYGSLKVVDALGYLMAWAKVKAANPDMDTAERRVLVEKGWTDADARGRVIEEATNLIGG